VRRATAYMFELSGGMCQRVMIAIAVAADPALLIADEPTTGLNVTTQAVVMDIVSRMYHGDALTAELLLHPRHPYARGLVAAAPRLDGVRSETRLSGDPRSPIDPDPNVCRFHGRCPIGTDLCATEMPPLRLFPDHREAACHYAEPPDGLHP
jgi:oligopeptide/dipeptide ABC transporter ATP-binding protein